MSANSPPWVFVLGVVAVPIVVTTAVFVIPSPCNWPIGIGLAVVVIVITRWLTARQVRREAELAEQESATAADE